MKAGKLPKPELLFTNKVLPFEEWLRNYLAGLTEVSVKPIYEALSFYTQTFTPDLIEKLFKGWENCGKDEDLLFENEIDGKYIVIPNDISGDTQFGFIDGEEYMPTGDFIYPQTLQQFISDCDRANIELVWAE
jgi:hypothetical protein